jgi:hypothetical protein
MKLMAGDDDLTRRLRATNPLPSGIAHTEATRARLDEIRLWARSGPRESETRAGWRLSFGRRGVRRGVVLASAAGVLIAGGAAAATTILSTTTVGAPGFCQTAINATSDIPFPSGDHAARNWALLQSANIRSGATLDQLCNNPAGAHLDPGGMTGNVQVHVGPISEKDVFASVAFCAWAGRWLKAEQIGDTSTASSDASEIFGATQWKSAQDVANAGSEALDWIPSAQHAVESGNVNEVASMFVYYTNANLAPTSVCWAYTPPANSDDGTINVPPAQ